MRLALASLGLAAALALAACALDDESADTAPGAASRAGEHEAAAAPAAAPATAPSPAPPPAATPPPPASPPASAPADADSTSTLSVFRRMVDSIAALAKPTDDNAPPANSSAAGITGANATASSGASADAAATDAKPDTGSALAALPPPAVAPPVGSPPINPSGVMPPSVAGPRAAGKPDAKICADVTADGPAREVDLQAVRRLLQGTDFKRGSFETNAAYRARVIVKLEAVQALAIEQTGRAELVFSLPIPPYRVSYDAAARALWIGSDLGLLQVGSAIGMSDFVVVSTSERQIGHHREMIAYGARRVPSGEREVTRVAGDELGVIVPGSSATGWPAKFERLKVPMPPAEAADRSGLAVLFVARLQEPIFVTGEFIQEPKLDEPVEKHLSVDAIKVAIDCAAIYDRRTGRLIHPLIPAGGG